MSVHFDLVCSPVPSNPRAVSGIELTLRKGTDIPNIKYNKEKVEGHKLKIQEILGTLDAQSSPFDKNPRVGERVPHIASINPHGTVKTSVSEIGATLALSSPILYRIPIASRFRLPFQLQQHVRV